MNNQAGTGTSTDGCEMNWQSLSTDDTVAFSNKPTDKHCDTTNWSEFLYSKFDPASTQLDDSDIEEDVYSLEEEAEKISGLPLESLTANELHKKNELIKFECKANELTDWDTVEVDLNEQDCKNVVATGKNEKLVLECNPEEKTPESQCIRDTASVDTSDKDEVNHEKNLSESHSEIETTQTSSGRKQIREKRIYPLYSCDHCDKTFIDSARLACHRLKAHGIEDKDTSMIRRSKRTANRKIPDVREFEKLQIEPMQQQAAEIALVESLVTDEIHIKDELIEFDCNDHELADATVEVADENNQSLETNVQESTPESQSLRGTVSADTCDKDAILTVQLFPKKKSSESQSETEEKSSTKNKPVVKKTMKYYCEHCDEVFIRWPRLLYHRARVHGIEDKDVGVLRCQCELCGKVCFSKDALARHRSTHKNAKKADFKFPCSYCDRKFSMDYNRVHHEQTHTKIYDHICRICDKGFISRMRLLFHDVQKHNRNTGEHSFPTCSVCGKLFANRSQLAVHEETHINNRVLTCELCVKSFKTMQTLKSHVSICQMSKLRKSKRKERREERRKEMMEKMKERRKERKKSMGKVNDSEKPANSCKTDAGLPLKSIASGTVKVDTAEDCRHVVVTGMTNRKLIIQSNPEEKTPKSQCIRDTMNVDTSDKELNHEKNLSGSHSETETTQSSSGRKEVKKRKYTTYSCDHCDRILSSWSRYVYHGLIMHGIENKDAGVSRCSCEFCGRVFVSEDVLSKHRSRHKNASIEDFKYPCSYCDRRFNRDFQKVLHERTHTKDYSNKCSFCDKGFGSRRAMLLHEFQEHDSAAADITFHSCPICGKLFHAKSALKVHESSHSNNPSYKCELCGNRYKKSYTLKYHFLTCKRNTSRIRGRKEAGERQAAGPLSETLTTDEIQIKDKLMESGWMSNTEKSTPESLAIQDAVDGKDCKSAANDEGRTGPRKKRVRPNRKTYSCGHCDKSFAYLPRLEWHRLRAHGIGEKDAGMFHCKCELCGRTFYDANTLASHRSMHKNAKKSDFKYQCSYCERMFREVRLKENHERSHTKNYKHRCRFCDMGFLFRKALLFHEARKHNSDNALSTFHSCSVCGLHCANAYRLALHEKLHSRSTLCEHCDKKFKNVRAKNAHSYTCKRNASMIGGRNRTANGENADAREFEKPKIEPMQQQVFPAGETDVRLPLESLTAGELHTKNELIESECTVNVEVDFNEQDCRNVAATDMNKEQVLESNLEEITPESQCIRDTVNVDTSDKDKMNHEKNLSESHSEIETTQTSSGRKQVRKKRKFTLYSCDHCDKTFSTWLRYVHHGLISHGIEIKNAGAARCSCEVCGRVFISEYALSKHLSVHKNANIEDFKYHCAYCDRRFNMSRLKVLHERTHTRDYTNKCSFCDKGFASRKAMLLHEFQKHDSAAADTTFYSCPVCGKLFHAMSALKVHESTHSNNLPYKCELCDKGYKESHNLKIHLITCKRNTSRIRGRKEVEERQAAGPLSETLTTDEIQIKDELIESGWADNDLVGSVLQANTLTIEDAVNINVSDKDGKSAANDKENDVALVESLVTDEIRIKDEIIKFDCTVNESADQDTVKAADENNQSIETNPQESTPESQSNRDAVSTDTRDKDALLTVQLFPEKPKLQIEEKPTLRNRQKSPKKNKREQTQHCCEYCDAVFIPWLRLLQHRAKVHGIEDKNVGVLRCECELCGKVCFSQDALARHRSAHKKTKKDDFKFHCSYCERKFSTKYHRFAHEQIHTKSYKQKCRFCDKGFTSRIRLSFHEAQKHNQNTGEYNFPSCSVCGKLFVNSSSLANHEMTHNAGRVMTCELCVKKFKTVQSLRAHMRICQISKLRIRKKRKWLTQSSEKVADSKEP